MIVRLRRCCCDLPTFVTLVSSVFSAFHICVILGTSLWYSLFARQRDSFRNKKSLLPDLEPVREVNDDNYESFVKGKSVVHLGSRDDPYGTGENSIDFVVYVVVLILAVIGIFVNVLVVVGVKLNRRWLFLPWLVFHLMGVLGSFAGGIYLALHYTLLQPVNTTVEDQAMAILSLFPIVGGIFLIFLWVLYDQAFIGMGASKTVGEETNESIHTSSTSVNKSLSNTALNTLSNSSLTYGPNLISVDYGPEIPTLYISNMKPPSVSSSNIRRKAHTDKMAYSKTQSLPRSKNRRHKIREFSVNLDMNLLKMKKAKSLEQILDGGSSNSSIGGTPNVWIADGQLFRMKQERAANQQNSAKSQSELRQRPPRRSSSFDDILNGTLVDIKLHQQSQQPSYHTVDRRGSKMTTFSSGRERGTRSSSALPRKRPELVYESDNILDTPVSKPLRRSRRSRSVEYLLETDLKPLESSQRHVSTTYLSAWDDRDLDTKGSVTDTRGNIRDWSSDTVRSVHSVKSVTIAPKVTEFHYSDELDTSMSEPDFTNRSSFDEDTSISQVPEPVFPNPPPPLPHTRHTSWLNKFSPIKPKTGFTRDQIIQYYCSGGDVAL